MIGAVVVSQVVLRNASLVTRQCHWSCLVFPPRRLALAGYCYRMVTNDVFILLVVLRFSH